MFDIPFPNTRYAEELDLLQQLDYEQELYNETTPLEEREEQEFAKRCKQSKVSFSRLKKYESELRMIQRKASEKLETLEWREKITKSAKKARELRDMQSAIRKQLETAEKALHDKYFAIKRKNKLKK